MQAQYGAPTTIAWPCQQACNIPVMLPSCITLLFRAPVDLVMQRQGDISHMITCSGCRDTALLLCKAGQQHSGHHHVCRACRHHACCTMSPCRLRQHARPCLGGRSARTCATP